MVLMQVFWVSGIVRNCFEICLNLKCCQDRMGSVFYGVAYSTRFKVEVCFYYASKNLSEFVSRE